jgi:hypothetical protein
MAAIHPTGRFVVLAGLDASVLLPGLYLAGALLVGAVLIAVIRRWWRGEDDKGGSASDQLAHYRTLYERGAISEEEFHRLRGVLAPELRRSVDLPPCPAHPGPTSTQADSPPQEGESPDKPPPDGIVRA